MKLKISTDSGTVKLENEAGRSVAIMACGNRIEDEDRAADITRAWNAHDDLVKQLAQALGSHQADKHMAVMCFICDGMSKALRKAGHTLQT